MPAARYTTSVLINCPFDPAYAPLFDAAVFAVLDCGYTPRCTLEIQDSGQARIDKILALIGQSRYGIHDISRTQPDRVSRLPRFNMPFELGLFLGARRFGSSRQRRKACLILDRDRYRYQKYLSDIAGQDIRAHGNRVEDVITAVRDWLSPLTKGRHLQPHLPLAPGREPSAAAAPRPLASCLCHPASCFLHCLSSAILQFDLASASGRGFI